MNRLYILTPALVAVAFMGGMFLVYCGLAAMGKRPKVAGVKHNEVFGEFIAGYMYWLMGPIERALIGRVSANAITTVSLLLCMGSGVAAGLGHLATACWLYVFAGVLDMLDGRLARATGQQNAAGALFDSVADRWGELAMFSGFVYYLRDSAWMLAVMAAVAGSMMVSYTRARGEGLGIALRGGSMQRAERIFLVALGTMIAAWLALTSSTAHLAPVALGIAMLVVGTLSSITAIGRLIEGYRALIAADAKLPAAPATTKPAPAAAASAAAPTHAAANASKSAERAATPSTLSPAPNGPSTGPDLSVRRTA